MFAESEAGLVEEAALFKLPGNKSDAAQFGTWECGGRSCEALRRGRNPCRERGDAGAEESARWRRLEDFAVHLLEHGLAIEWIHSSAEESEVHVELRAPCGVVGAGFFVVALEASQRVWLMRM